MPGTATISTTTTGTGAAEFATRRIDAGQLQGLALIGITDDIQYGELYATVGVMRGGEGDEFIAAIFLEDFLSTNHHPSYNGTYDFMTGDILFLRLVTLDPYAVRLTATVYRDDEDT